MKESVFVNNFCGSLRVLVIALHHIEASTAHLTLHAYRTFLVGLRVEHLHFHEWEVAAHSCATLLESIRQTGLSHTGRTLRESIHAGDGHEHLLAHFLHQFPGAEATGHDTRAEG